MRYPVITVRQFYAALLALGIKGMENRSKPFPAKLMGQTILIHAGGQWHDEFRSPCLSDDRRFTYMVMHATSRSRLTAYEVLAKIEASPHVVWRGGIVGAMRITGELELPTDTFEMQLAYPWAIPGHHHWRVEDARPVPWHPCPGKLGIWYLDYPHDVPEVV